VEIRLVKTDKQHRLYLAAIEKLMENDPAPNSAAGARLELLAKLVEDYEKVRYPIQKPDAVEIIRFRMEQQGLRQKDLAAVLGGKNRVSEILSRKRPLTVPMIRALGRHLQIPAELLVR